MFLGGDEDLDHGISSMLYGTATKAILNIQAAGPFILDQWESFRGM
jgi:hypothetical protein